MVKHLQFVTYWGYFFLGFCTQTKTGKVKNITQQQQQQLANGTFKFQSWAAPTTSRWNFLAPIFRSTHKQQLADGNFWVPVFRGPSIVATACRCNSWVPIFRCRCSSSTGATACRAFSIFRCTVPQQQQQQM